jgi:hypothetical protein
MIDKAIAAKRIDDLISAAKDQAQAAGLRLEISHEIRDPEIERLQNLIQSNLSSAKSQLLAAIAAARKLGLEQLDFLGGILKWGDGGIDADGGPRIFEEWNQSSFDCYPSDEHWEWLHGPNPPPKPYDDDGGGMPW